MKILNKYYLPALALTLGMACTELDDAALDAESFNRPSEAGEGAEAAAALQGTYNQLNAFSDQAGIYALQEHPSDEMMGPTRGTDWSDFGVWRQLHLHSWDASHEFVFNAWNILNTGQLRATQVIDAPNASAQQIAEARFLRSYYIYNIVDLYGQVPIRLDLDDPNEIPTVLSRAEATQLIIDDLDAAIPNLPSLNGANTGQATVEAAHFLRAKVYLNRAVFTAAEPAGPYNFTNEDMQAVIESTDVVLNSSVSLTPFYWDNFVPDNRTTSREIIFARRNETGNAVASVQNRYKMTIHYNQVPGSGGGWNGFTTVADFYNKWGETDDVRKGQALPGFTDRHGLRVGFLEGQQFDGAGNPLTDRGGNPLVFTPEVSLLYSNERQGVRVIKYPPDPNNLADNLIGTDYIFFRYADAWLMRAEALFRTGNTGEALAMVNGLREARGAEPLASLTEMGLLDERGFELYWEGWRRNDQIRFGMFLQEWQNKPVTPPHVVLFPIPQRAMDTNPNFTQNPGY
ncbi:RagB/SusD family nutrient uptake outer membrane protein [Litoribacter ruber]|uniref:RagB/SusD family nutrient uptake outer membrane protein n=1 Tax=Litoribacter ruber TaxID=702568 RepID=A0AAP2CIP9_9BACT|nr:MULTISPECIES: RagB/SusD family nutrient uptake outer membrane protein [Litoribacter]MBS9523991.1 RagB/SusD family nutrient uptake outer membrane protein [Litoribacter alkaliphilus]MBT0811420.1 RagB/SusD family nutrient uptake outer membrane protein [Litoribacter ruber]